MARLIPTIPVEQIEIKPERDVARVLVEQLPDNVIVYHSYPWLRPDRNNRTGKVTLQEGEADFLILWPDFGLLVLEVKGGDIHYQPEDHRWYRQLPNGNERDIKDPFKQASKSLHTLIDNIRDRAYPKKAELLTHGYAAIFPDVIYKGSTPPGSHPSILLSANHLPRIKDALQSAFKHWSRSLKPIPIPKEKLPAIKQVILPHFQLIPILFRTIEEQEDRIFRMTDEQMELLDFINVNKRAAIEGVAGSGKTLMAIAQAQRLASEGKHTLFLCYNRNLAEWLRSTLPPEFNESIEILNFHKLCLDYCRKAEIPFRPPQEKLSEFWNKTAPELLWESLELLQDRFDAVVVDEGQDFIADWWEPIELINKEGGCCVPRYPRASISTYLR